MSKIASSVIEVGSLGLIDDPFGIEAGEDAASDAAGAQVAGTQAGIAETRRQFDLSREDLAPFREAGAGAIGAQQDLLGLSGAEAQEAAFAGLQESSGQKFIRERQQKALVRRAGAIGGLGGANVRTALQEQAAGFAQQDIQNQFGRLGQLAGQGQAATTETGRLGSAAASNISGLHQFGGAARASGILGQASIAPQVTGQLFQLGGQFAGAALSDERLKTDKIEIDRDDAGGIYKFKYIGSSIEYIGRMAQELFMTNPDAVSLHPSGYLQVSAEFAPRVA